MNASPFQNTFMLRQQEVGVFSPRRAKQEASPVEGGFFWLLFFDAKEK
jgi:hypothetical protein